MRDTRTARAIGCAPASEGRLIPDEFTNLTTKGKDVLRLKVRSRHPRISHKSPK
jgi:hypothetical protein